MTDRASWIAAAAPWVFILVAIQVAKIPPVRRALRRRGWSFPEDP
jgi:hypothetical protein